MMVRVGAAAVALALLAGCGSDGANGHGGQVRIQPAAPGPVLAASMGKTSALEVPQLPAGALFAGKLEAYTIVKSGDAWVVTEKAGAKTVRTVDGAARLLFADATVATDVSTIPARAYRLYQAAFDRSPDLAGLGFHITAMDGGGATLDQVAQGFIDSAEFSSKYGALDNRKFMVQLYSNILHRAPDPAGLAYWLDLLDSKAITRAKVLGGFSESPENIANVAPAIANGIAYLPYVVPGTAVAALLRAESGKIAWHADNALDVVLRDARGTEVPGGQLACKAVDPVVLTISADCRVAQGMRLGQHQVLVSGGGLSAKLGVQVIPQRKPFGTQGNVQHDHLVATSAGNVLGWGDNSFDSMGQGWPRVAAYSVPQMVKDGSGSGPLNGVAAVAGGNYGTMALLENGEIVGWSSTRLPFGRLGPFNGLPVPVRNPANDGNLRNIVQLSFGQLNAIGLTDDGRVMSWGDFHGQGFTDTADFPNLVRHPSGSGALTNIVAISAGGNFGNAMADDGRVYAWGTNNAGETGRGVKGAVRVLAAPVLAEDGKELTNIVAISAGYRFTLALAADGRVYGWGANDFGELGQNHDEGEYAKAILVKDSTGTGVLGNIVMVSAGGHHALALDSAGRVMSWGYRENGELGEGANRVRVGPNRPMFVVGTDGTGALDGIVSIATGFSNSLALRKDGAVLIWGAGNSGSLGQGTASTLKSAVPTSVKYAGGNLLLPPAAYHNLLNRGR